MPTKSNANIQRELKKVMGSFGKKPPTKKTPSTNRRPSKSRTIA